MNDGYMPSIIQAFMMVGKIADVRRSISDQPVAENGDKRSFGQVHWIYLAALLSGTTSHGN